MGLGRSSCLW